MHPRHLGALIGAMCALANVSFAYADSPSGSVPGSVSETAGGPALRDTMALPTVVEPTSEKLDRSHGESWSRAELQLSGSMCPACLLELEEKLRAVPGINFAHIDRVAAASKSSNSTTAAGELKAEPKRNSNQAARVAQAVIIFDSHSVSFDRLEHFIKRENYKPVTVKQVSLEPSKL